MQDNRSLSEPTSDEYYNPYESDDTENYTNYDFEAHSIEYTTREFEDFNRDMIEFNNIKQAEAEAAAAAALKLAEAEAAAAATLKLAEAAAAAALKKKK